MKAIGRYIKQNWNQIEWGKELEIHGLSVNSCVSYAIPDTATVSKGFCSETIEHEEN